MADLEEEYEGVVGTRTKIAPTTNQDDSGLGTVELDGKGEELLEVAEEAAKLLE